MISSCLFLVNCELCLFVAACLLLIVNSGCLFVVNVELCMFACCKLGTVSSGLFALTEPGASPKRFEVSLVKVISLL